MRQYQERSRREGNKEKMTEGKGRREDHGWDKRGKGKR